MSLCIMSWDSVFGVATRLMAGQPDFDSWEGQDDFLFSIESRLTLGSTHPLIQ
jgi:hypothetical protein